jgi:hypothetical protein
MPKSNPQQSPYLKKRTPAGTYSDPYSREAPTFPLQPLLPRSLRLPPVRSLPPARAASPSYTLSSSYAAPPRSRVAACSPPSNPTVAKLHSVELERLRRHGRASPGRA